MQIFTPSQFATEVLGGARKPITIRRWCENGKIIGYEGVTKVERTPTNGWLIYRDDLSVTSNIENLRNLMIKKAA